MGAQGSRSGLAFKKETVLGERVIGEFTGINFTAETFKAEPVFKESKTIRPDRQQSNVYKISDSLEGDFTSELQTGNLDFLLPSMLWVEDWISAGSVVSTTSFVTETEPGIGGIIQFNAGATIALQPGNFFAINDAVNPLNNGIHQVKAIEGKNVQVFSPLVTEVATANIVLSGENIRNGVVRSSWNIEKAFYDTVSFWLMLGMVPASLEVSVEVEEAISLVCKFIGMTEETAEEAFSDPAPSDLVTDAAFTASTNVLEILVANTPLAACEIQKISFLLDQKVEGKKGVGFSGNCNINGKSISTTGKVSFYFSSLVQYNRFKDAVAFSLVMKTKDENGISYVFEIPYCKYDKATANVKGKDDDTLFDGSFIATVGPNNYTFQITKAIITE